MSFGTLQKYSLINKKTNPNLKYLILLPLFTVKLAYYTSTVLDYMTGSGKVHT